VIHNGMPYDLLRDHGYGGLKCAEMANFKGCRQYACNQKTMGELEYSKTVSKF